MWLKLKASVESETNMSLKCTSFVVSSYCTLNATIEVKYSKYDCVYNKAIKHI